MIADGCGFSFGVLYSELLDYFGESKGKTAWVGSLFLSVPLITGPVASALTNRFGCRKTTIVGSLIATAGFVLSAFMPNIEWLCFSFGVIAGLGLSMVYVPAVVVVAYYFEKKRAFATGIAVSGSGVGTFIFAPLTEFLITTFGWRGAVLIIGGAMLNIAVCGAVFRPPESARIRRRRKFLKSLEKFSRCSSRQTVEDTNSVYNTQSSYYHDYGIDPYVSEEHSKIYELLSKPVTHSLIAFPTYHAKGELDPYVPSSVVTATPQEKTVRKGSSLTDFNTDAKSSKNVSNTTSDPTLLDQPETKPLVTMVIGSMKSLEKLPLSQSNESVHSVTKPNGNGILVKKQLSAEEKEMKIKLLNEKLASECNGSGENGPENTLSGSTDVGGEHKYVSSSHSAAGDGKDTDNDKIEETAPEKVTPLQHKNSKRVDGPWQKRQVNKKSSLPAPNWPYPLSRKDIFYRGSLQRMSGNLPRLKASSCPNIFMSQVSSSSEESLCPYDCSHEIKHIMKAMISISILRNPYFLIFASSNMLLYMWYDVPYVYTTDWAKHKGFSENEASFLVSIIGITSMIGQIIIGYIGDRPRVNSPQLYNGLTTVAGIATMLVPLCNTYVALSIYSAFFGFFISGNYALTTIILVNLLGMDRLTNAYGLLMLGQGIANLIGPPLAGRFLLKNRYMFCVLKLRRSRFQYSNHIVCFTWQVQFSTLATPIL